MTIVVKSGLAEKVSNVLRSERFILTRISGTLALIFLFMILSTVAFKSAQFKDMEVGLHWLAVLYIAKMFLTVVCSITAGEFRFRQHAMTVDWLISGAFRLGGVLLILSSEAAFVGHGLRGWLWVALIGYQLVAAAANFMTAHGVKHGFERFDLPARRRARAHNHFVNSVLADLAKTLKV